ncbi:MAG: dual specificity protein phosphatase family protein [Candidatus Riflebacteria bacterium]
MVEEITSRMYEVEPGKIYAGPIPSAADPGMILEVVRHPIEKWGVRTFINLMEEDETNSSGQPFNSYIEAARSIDQSIEMLRLPIPDCTAPNHEFMRKILDEIDSRLREGRPVYVHCWGGLGRTGVVVCCWLKRHGEADPLEKLRRLRACTNNSHRASPQSHDQYSLVKNWMKGF